MKDDFDNGMSIPDEDLAGESAVRDLGGLAGGIEEVDAEIVTIESVGRPSGAARSRSASPRKARSAKKAAPAATKPAKKAAKKAVKKAKPARKVAKKAARKAKPARKAAKKSAKKAPKKVVRKTKKAGKKK